MRLSPFFPIDLTSYALGLTEVPLGKYVLASWLGKLPGGLLCVYIGSVARSISELAAGRIQIGIVEPTLLVLGLLVTIAAVLYVTHLARRASPRRGRRGGRRQGTAVGRPRRGKMKSSHG